MKILLTGANGYIGTRLLYLLVKAGHDVVALVRRFSSVHIPDSHEKQVTIFEADLLDQKSLEKIPKDIDAAYYFVHSMAKKEEDFEKLDQKAAQNFVEAINHTQCKKLIYLTGLISNKKLSKHLRSRLEVENILKTAKPPLTSLRAGIIIGSGSASFEMIRDLVEKLPIMVAPKWVQSKCQPIAVRDVLEYLIGVLDSEACKDQTFDIGGPDVLTYRDMLLEYAKVRHLFRLIIPVPVLTPRLSSYWLIFITSTNYFLARSLIDSVKNDAVCQNRRIQEVLPKKCLAYKEALRIALDKIAADQVLSTWKDSWTSSKLGQVSSKDVEVPKYGCLSMKASIQFKEHPDEVFGRVMQMGDRMGWRFMNWAWRIRGLADRAIGGVGLRKGRRSQKELRPGDVVDFWRVIHVDAKERRLLLLAEMKLPGDAWLAFRIHEGYSLEQTAIFRPRGVFGRLYWYAFYPVHLLLFPGMLRQLVKGYQ